MTEQFEGTTFKRCSCKSSVSGKYLRSNCPKIKRRSGSWSTDHGSWYYQAELPSRPGDRRTRRRGGFASQGDAKAVLDAMKELIEAAQPYGDRALIAVGDVIDERLRTKEPFPAPEDLVKRFASSPDSPEYMPTVEEWLEKWLAGRKKLRASTKLSYSQHMRLWLVPWLGRHRLDELTVEHVAHMFDAMEERNEVIRAARASDDPDVRKSVRGVRTMSGATMHRYRATLRSALNAAIKHPKIKLTFNPAAYVELPSGKRPKALLWTPARVERWKLTGKKPSQVMVWMPDQVGRFLDEAEGHPYYPLLHIIAHRGLRRGEACALPWWDVDLAGKELTVSAALVQVGWSAELGAPKSDASGRQIALDQGSSDVLRQQKLDQQLLREAAGDAWTELGLVCTEPDGSLIHPAKLTDAFQDIAEAAGLPPTRLHDLRHAAATIALASGSDLKQVQELLGHSSIAITSDTYTHVLPELARESAEAAAAIIPRRAHRELTGAST